MKKQILANTLATSLFFGSVYANEIYQVKKGDFLSGILRTRYPKLQIYGPKGTLKKLLALNPHIKNPNLVLPIQEIILPSFDEAPKMSSVEPVTPAEEIMSQPIDIAPTAEEIPAAEEVKEPHSISPWLSKFYATLTYGFRFYTESQEGSMGNADIGSSTFSNFGGQIGYNFSNSTLELNWERYNFDYKKAEKNGTQALSNLSLNYYVNNLIFHLARIDMPLIYNDNGLVTFSPQTQTLIGAGLRKEYNWEDQIADYAELKGILRIPVTQSNADSGLTSSGLKGYGIIGQGNLAKKIMDKPNYNLHVVWRNEIGWQKTNQEIKYSTGSSDVDTTFSHLSSQVGVKIEMK
jgi:LysM repeat protein